MVVFTCNACGQSVKKKQAENHCIQCRRFECFSCMDCGKDFWGNQYIQHTKCISEEEKYGGKNYVAKPSANKGEKKQEEWTKQIKEIVTSRKTSDELQKLLNGLLDFDNIPVQKRKFTNFVKNSFKGLNPSLITQAWEIISKSKTQKAQDKLENATKVEANTSMKNRKKKEKYKQKKNGEVDMSTDANNEQNRNEASGDKCTEIPLAETIETKKKRKRVKDECGELNAQPDIPLPSHKKKKHKRGEEVCNELDADSNMQSKEQKKRDEECDESKINADPPSRKQKKNKHGDDDCAESKTDQSLSSPKHKRKKHRQEMDFLKDAKSNDVNGQSGVVKFRLGGVIRAVLEASGDKELSVKKLLKKVAAEYSAHSKKPMTKEEIEAKIRKKIKKNPKIRFIKERVKLLE